MAYLTGLTNIAFHRDGLTSASLMLWEMEYGFCCQWHRVDLAVKHEGGEMLVIDC
jgi:hypothetical protein